MGDFGNQKTIVTRKDHRCAWCGEIIPKGSTVPFCEGRFEDNFFRWRMHPECNDALNREDLMMDEGFCSYEHKRGMTTGEEYDKKRENKL